jgi:hypothetical protein
VNQNATNARSRIVSLLAFAGAVAVEGIVFVACLIGFSSLASSALVKAF